LATPIYVGVELEEEGRMDYKTKYKPEERAEIRIGSWLQENGIEIFLNRKSRIERSLCCGIFSIKGSLKKPDMVIKTGENGYGVLEIKPGIHGKEMRDGHKIISYYDSYRKGEVKYFINGDEIFPKIFLVATQYSPDGKLTQREDVKKVVDSEKARIRGTPKIEYDQTFNFVRMLWQLWKENKDRKHMLGVLLSDKLDGGVGIPHAFVQKFNERIGKWQPPHRFLRL